MRGKGANLVCEKRGHSRMSDLCAAIAANDTSGVLSRRSIQRRRPRPNDVAIDILFCGICHSDLHQIRGEWDQDVYYPMVPGHEIVGIVAAVGEDVSRHAVGDRVGVGVFVDSCRECSSCRSGQEVGRWPILRFPIQSDRFVRSSLLAHV